MASARALCRRLAGLSLQKAPLRSSLTNGLAAAPQPLKAPIQTDLYSLSFQNATKLTFRRSLSTQVITTSGDTEGPTATTPKLVQTEDGRQFAYFDTRKYPKLKPYIVKRRLSRMRTYEGGEKNIRHSPWRLNLICQLVAGLPLTEAMTQLEFCQKSKAPLVQKVLKRISNLADIRDGLQPSQLEVAECFATKGSPLKRVKPMGRGRYGRMERKHSHFRVVLREIDFKLKLVQAPTVNQKKKWFQLQQQAERDGAQAKAERDEMARLEREAASAAKKSAA